MKCVVGPSEVEEITLQQLSIKQRHRDEPARAAGQLQLGRRVWSKVIAEQLGISDQSAHSRAHTCCADGVRG
jgi:predicted DNA binding protein